jgi:predicted metal-dependent phosphoesterase TrpH
VIHEAGGIASLAHPGLLRRDDLVPGLAAAGLDALEAYHSEHGAVDVQRYLALAQQHGLAVSGGSDFHGESRDVAVAPGSVRLPVEDFERLVTRVRSAARTVDRHDP